MEITKEMQEMMERTMEQYFAAYWEKHATPEMESKRVAEGKTFKDAYHYAHTIAKHYQHKPNGENCVAMPDELAYWILMHYMENEAEGAEYMTAEEIEQEKKRAIEREKEKQRKLEEKAKKQNEGGALIPVTADDLKKAEEEAARIKAETKRIEAEAKARIKSASAVAEKIEQTTLF